MYVILVYDIKENIGSQLVWRKTFKTCKSYLTNVQKSVFEGELKESQFFILKEQLKKILREECDSCIVYQFRNSEPDHKEIWGNQYDAMDFFI